MHHRDCPFVMGVRFWSAEEWLVPSDDGQNRAQRFVNVGLAWLIRLMEAWSCYVCHINIVVSTIWGENLTTGAMLLSLASFLSPHVEQKEPIMQFYCKYSSDTCFRLALSIWNSRSLCACCYVDYNFKRILTRPPGDFTPAGDGVLSNVLNLWTPFIMSLIMSKLLTVTLKNMASFFPPGKEKPPMASAILGINFLNAQDTFSCFIESN